MLVPILLFVFAIFCLVMGILGFKKQKETSQQQSDMWSKYMKNLLTNFTISRHFATRYFRLLVDNMRKEFVLTRFDNNNNVIEARFSFEDVISVEIVKNGQTYSSKSALGTIGGAVVGGVLAGGVGSIIGGLSSESQTFEKVSEICIKWHLRSVNNPTYIGYIHKDLIIESKDALYKDCMKQAIEIMDLFAVIIDEINQRQQANNVTINTAQLSIADELQKLLVLKNQGVLSEDEFNEQKKSLLNTQGDKLLS